MNPTQRVVKLIHDVQIQAADELYAKAHDKIDKFQVAHAWLAIGEVMRAWLTGCQDIEILNAYEVCTLGYTLRPPTMPIEMRWDKPTKLPQEGLVRWFAGRIYEQIDANHAVLFFANGDGPMETRHVWRKIIQGFFEEGAFLEIGEYQDGSLRIETIDYP